MTDDTNDDGGNNEVGQTIRKQLTAGRDRVVGWLRAHATHLQMAGAIAAVGVVFVVLAWFAVSGWGALAGGLFIGGVIAGASGPPLAILMFRDGLPLGGLVGTGLVIAAQIAFGKAALVRRDDGTYEWTALRNDGFGYYATLADGRDVPIDAEAGELFSFGFGRLAVTEQKTDRNMNRYQETPVPGDSDQPTGERAGVPVVPPRNESGGILVSLANIQRAIRGSASSTLVRRGRDKALDEEGGTGQLSELWTMAFATVLLLAGFAMTAGALML
jgi:hypothetical protein